MDINFVREQFPALKSGFIFMDNAGGSQILGRSVGHISDYLIESNVQLGASYKVSTLSGERLNKVTSQIAGLINAEDSKEVVIGPTSTMLLRILSLCISEQWKKGERLSSPIPITKLTFPAGQIFSKKGSTSGSGKLILKPLNWR